MIVDWLQLGSAVLLLLVPTAWFHGPKVRYRPIRRDWSRHWRPMLSLGWHAIDLGRATLGAWLLVEAVARDPAASGWAGRAPLLWQATVLGVAILVQTACCRERDAFQAPFTFVAGVVFGFLPPVIAGFAVLFAVVITLGVRLPALYFPLLAVSVPAAALLFGGRSMTVPSALIGGIAIAPWLLSLLFRRALVVSYRARRGGESHPPIARPESSAPFPPAQR